jgi:hypothetical protein
MNNTEMSLVKDSLLNVVDNHRCPQCGGLMKEAERHKEGSITYVWFECVKADCDGRWLQSYKLLPVQQAGDFDN